MKDMMLKEATLARNKPCSKVQLSAITDIRKIKIRMHTYRMYDLLRM